MRETEREVLVTDFATLRQGDLVVVKCPCGKDARGILMNTRDVMLIDGSQSPVWFRSPPHFCGGYMNEHVISPGAVARRIVFKVDTGLSRDTDTHEAAPVKKPRELVRGTR